MPEIDEVTLTEEEKELTIEEPQEISTATSDSILNELLQTEKEMSDQTLKIMQNRFQKEKENWTKLYTSRETELSSMRLRLSDTEKRLKGLQEQQTQETLADLEKEKLYADQIKVRQIKEADKWKTIEDQIKLYRDIAENIQQKLNEEQKKNVQISQIHLQEEFAFKKQVDQMQDEILKSRQELIDKEQSLLKSQSKYEEEKQELKEQIKKLENNVTDEKTSYVILNEKKDENISKLQKNLQEALVNFTEQKNLNGNLQSEITIKNKILQELEEQNKVIAIKIELERKNWQQVWEKEQTEWEKYKHKTLEKEQLLTIQTEEQLSKIISMLNSVEEQLKVERSNNKKFQSDIEELNNQIQLGTVEKNKLEETIKKLTAGIELEKVVITNRYENLLGTKLQETQRLQTEINQLRGELKENQNIYALEKQDHTELKKQFEAFKENAQRISEQFVQERDTWKTNMIEEQMRNDETLKKLNEYIKRLNNVRDEELKTVQQELQISNGELGELRSMYQLTRIENEQQKAKISELNEEFKKVFSQWERERIEWEDLLVAEQTNWQKMKAEILIREQILRKQTEDENKTLYASVDKLTRNVVEMEHTIQNKDIENNQLLIKLGDYETEKAKNSVNSNDFIQKLNQEKIEKEQILSDKILLQEQIIKLEQQLKTELQFSDEYKSEYNRFYQELLKSRKENNNLQKKIKELELQISSPSS